MPIKLTNDVENIQKAGVKIGQIFKIFMVQYLACFITKNINLLWIKRTLAFMINFCNKPSKILHYENLQNAHQHHENLAIFTPAFWMFSTSFVSFIGISKLNDALSALLVPVNI